MRFDDENWVKLYTRDTLTWLELGWEGQFVLMSLMRKVDRAGTLDVGSRNPAEAIAVVLRCPLEVAQSGWDALLSTGSAVLHDGTVFLPKFLDAQETRQSDAQRKRRSREVAAAKSAGKPVTGCDPVSRPVTPGHTSSHPVRNRGEEKRLDETPAKDLVRSGAVEPDASPASNASLPGANARKAQELVQVDEPQCGASEVEPAGVNPPPAAPGEGMEGMEGSRTRAEAALLDAPHQPAQTVEGLELRRLEGSYRAIGVPVAAVRQALGATRKGGQIADSVWIGAMQGWTQYATTAVKAGVEKYLAEGFATENKREEYLLGIIRGKAREVDKPPVMSLFGKQGRSPSTRVVTSDLPGAGDLEHAFCTWLESTGRTDPMAPRYEAAARAWLAEEKRDEALVAKFKPLLVKWALVTA